MASIRMANCMELWLVRVWHQPTGCIPRPPFALDSIPQQVADFIHGKAAIYCEKKDMKRNFLLVLYCLLSLKSVEKSKQKDAIYHAALENGERLCYNVNKKRKGVL